VSPFFPIMGLGRPIDKSERKQSYLSGVADHGSAVASFTPGH
jgi:hypothetical protein